MPSQLQAESDQSYMGFASRLDPANLPEGILQAAQNVRLQRGIAQPRKGCQRLTDPSLNSLTMVGSGIWVDALGRDNIAMVFTDRLYFYRPEQQGTPPALLGPYTFPAGRTIAIGGIVDCVQALDKLVIFRGKYDSTIFSASVTNASISNGSTGTITVTTTITHGYSTGDEVTLRHGIFDTESALDGSHIITVTSPTQFTFSWTNTTGNIFQAHTNKTPFTTVRGKPPLIWDSSTLIVSVANQQYVNPGSGTALTYITKSLPPADFGFYYQNRVVGKYTDHQLVASDILSFETDVQFNAFTVNQGGNDIIVGCLPWIENQFLVFMRNSIYVAFLDPRFDITQPDQSQITVVSTELGCLARKSIVNAGQFVFFLSSKGVHLLTPQLDLKVIGNTMPLSEPIADFFQTLNYSTAANSVATYYNNRFYIALPVSDAINNPSGRNNRILIYNTLNKNWESIDKYPVGLFSDNLLPGAYLNQKRLFIVTNFLGPEQYGGVFLEEEREYGDLYIGGTTVGLTLPFSLPGDIGTGFELDTIESFVRTREFTMKSLSEKRFSRGEFQFNNVFNDVVNIDATMHDPDSTQNILGYQFSGTSDGTLRPRIADRGSSVDFTIHFTNGRPALKGITVYGINASRPMVSQE
jgi:hypothetical protein